MFTEPYINLKSIFENEHNALMYLTENYYVNRFEKCLECGNDNKLYLNKNLYICKNHKCRKSYSPLRGTIFIKMKLPLNKQLQIENYLLLKMPCSSVASYLQLSKKYSNCIS